LCEVEGYVYAAKREAAELASVLKQSAMGTRLLREAHRLQDQFERAFWCDDLSMYGLALDGRKRQCRVRTSNPGHCLFSGISSQENAQRIAQSLLGNDMFSGWGIRTVATSEARFNPMSYHNGSVWPHDNALIALGLARYGHKEGVLKIITGLFDASLHVDLHRLPELFCGFVRRPGGSPTLYPVACAPQAWSAASVFFLLQTCLGLAIHAHEARIEFSTSLLPGFLQELIIKNLKVGRTSVDLSLQRHALDVGIEFLRSEGKINIFVRSS
jgi:glycogen debranching enzyme